MKKILVYISVIAIITAALILGEELKESFAPPAVPASSDHIKWVEFSLPKSALDDALELDISTYETEEHIPMYVSLAYYAAKNYGEVKNYKKGTITKLGKDIPSLAKKLENQKLYQYYLEAYGAILSGMIGEYTRSESNGEENEKSYGLRAFSPIAAGYYYKDYDDFGASRSYGYKRSHLGHDLLGSVGTPIIAIESGTVEAVGWNMYGGWRIGIRSFDGKRYYYYAHLKKDHPYNDIYEGKTVNAGEVIGYLGMTGYSQKENTNNINIPHLHVGLQLIFDEEQKEGTNQIWIDLYSLTKFLYKNRSEVIFQNDSSEYEAKYSFLYEETPD